MIIIDGSLGEGGGQLLRSALSLSLCTGQAFEIRKIRAGRARPGLMRQHLTAVHAAMEVGQATVEGDAIGSQSLTFRPGMVRAGDFTFAIGTAGSTTLVLQTILMPLLTAPGPSMITLEGGTHNPFAPPFDFLARAFVPIINSMGPQVTASLEKPGFYPAGGGRIRVTIAPAAKLTGFALLDRGAITARRARAIVANLPRQIAERELKVIMRRLNWNEDELHVEQAQGSSGPGNVVLIEVECEHVTEVFTGFGERERSAEAVAEHASQQCRRYLGAEVPVGEYLTDQLLLPLALAGSGTFRCIGLSRHATTHVELIRQFIDLPVRAEQTGRRDTTVFIGS